MLVFLAFVALVSAQCDAAFERSCVENGGSWSLARTPCCTCSTTRICSGGTRDANTCACLCDANRAAACVAPNVFNHTTCVCATPPATCEQALIDRCKAANGQFDSVKCVCNPPPCPLTTATCSAMGRVFNASACACVCDADRVAACVLLNGQFDSAKCVCNTPSPMCEQALIDRCKAANGQFDSVKCVCNTTPPPPMCEQALIDRCKAANGNFLFATCSCITSTCDLAKQRCDSVQGMFDAASCTCTGGCTLTVAACAGSGKVFNPRTCACDGTIVCSDERRAFCQMNNGKFDEATCGCALPTPVCDATLKTRCLTVATNKWDETRCSCVAPPPPTCDAALSTRIAESCKASGLTFNTATCSCDANQCDLKALNERCVAPGVVNARACLCETGVVTPPPTCDRMRLELACKERGLATLPTPQCDCAPAANQCSDDALRACERLNQAGQGLFRANPRLCVCDEVCNFVDGQSKCGASETFDRATCRCVAATTPAPTDACARRMTTRDAMATRCKTANLRFDETTCSCVEAVKCDLTSTQCPQGIDVNNCACLTSPCALSAERAGAVATNCLAQAGYVFSRETCSCEQVCTEGEYKGLFVSQVFKRCVGAGGQFERPCKCSLPKPPTMCSVTRCANAAQVIGPNCECVDICPDGRVYGDAKAQCIAAGGQFSADSCACSRVCSADQLAVAKERCDKIGGKLDETKCACTPPSTRCDLTSAAVADVRAACELNFGHRFNPETCSCDAIRVVPQCEAGAERACAAMPGAAFDAVSCECRQRCAATDARVASDAARKCADGQVYDASSCSCVATQCGGARRSDIALQSCAANQLFDRASCGCVEVCPAQKAREAAAMCNGVFDFVSCTCRATKSCGAAAEALKLRCQSIDGFTFDAATCACKASSVIEIKVKGDENLDALKQRLALLLKACDVQFTEKMPSRFELSFGSLDAAGGNCVANTSSLVQQIAADGAVEEALLKAVVDVPMTQAGVNGVERLVLAASSLLVAVALLL